MLSFGLSNLRRLKDVPLIELKRISILVGRNSSGKSSFLRTFPLLRQSLMTRTSSPILWYGDLVDFGSFDVSVSDHSLDDPIVFSFALDSVRSADSLRTYWPRFNKSEPQIYHGVRVSLNIARAGERTRISRIQVTVREPRLNYDVLIGENNAVQSVKLDGKEVSEILSPIKFQITPGTILPEIAIIPDEGAELTARSNPYYRAPHQFAGPIQNFLKKYLVRLKEHYLASMINEMLFTGLLEKQQIQERFGGFGPQLLQKFISDVSGQDRRGIYPVLRDMLSLAALPAILSQVRLRLRAIIASTLYIGPARARSERYYRYQDLAVAEIDPDGKNFPMFLNSLPPYQINQLSNWIEELFGYGLNITRQSGGGHMSINLVSKGTTSNIVDTGYGVSQILPVLGQIWWARSRPPQMRDAEMSLLAIEQPELHLHPAHQALLADALVSVVTATSNTPSDASKPIHFLIETHSETLLNRLGELVAEGKILNSDIQVMLFEPVDENSRLTDVRISSFGESGELLNWPYGFFQPSVR